MEVLCPQCKTPNETVDERTLGADHLITCIRCGTQFQRSGLADRGTIDDFGEDATGIDEASLDRRSRSVRIPLDQVDWAEIDNSEMGDSVSLGPALENVRRGRTPMSANAGTLTPTPADSSNPIEQESFVRATEGRWTWRDLPLAFTAIFQVNRLAVAILGIWASLVVHGLIQWFGAWASTRNLGLGTLFTLMASAVFLILFVLVSAVCSVLCQTALIDGRRITTREAIQWTRNWVQSVLGTPLAFVAVVALAVIVEAVFGFIGRIPIVGPPIWGMLTPVTIVTSLVGGLAVIALAYSLPIYIPVIYNERTAPLDTLNRLLELLRERGARIISSLLGMMILTATAAVVVLYPAWVVATQLSTRVATATMGPGLAGLVQEVPGVFSSGIFLFLNVSAVPTAAVTNASHVTGGIFAGILATLGPAIVLGTVTLVICASGCITYAIVTGRRKE